MCTPQPVIGQQGDSTKLQRGSLSDCSKDITVLDNNVLRVVLPLQAQFENECFPLNQGLNNNK